MTEIRYSGHFTPTDRFDGLYRSFDFDVPPDCPGIAVDLYYRKTAEQALDLGLFDTAGFRGWSGSSRQHITVAPHATTPGYLTGPIGEGQWKVELGLHRIPPQGLDYELVITLGPVTVIPNSPAPAPAPAPMTTINRKRELPAPPGLTWLAGTFHTHTQHSTGTETVAELALSAVSAGLDFLAITDYNTTSHHQELGAAAHASGLILVPGVTVAIDTGHATVLGDVGWPDLRTEPADWATAVKAAGGLISINHPVKPDGAWRTPLPFAPDLAEIWHSSWDGRDGSAQAWWVAAGLGITPIGGADWHGAGSPDVLTSPVTWVLSKDGDVLDGLRRGRTAISASLDGPFVLRVNGEIVIIDGDGLVLADLNGQSWPVSGNHVRVPAKDTPYLLQTPLGRTLAMTA